MSSGILDPEKVRTRSRGGNLTQASRLGQYQNHPPTVFNVCFIRLCSFFSWFVWRPNLAQCWPFAKDVEAFHIEKLFENGNEAFVTYLGQPIVRPSFRNTEFFRVENGKVQEVVVYFGRTTEEAQPAGA